LDSRQLAIPEGEQTNISVRLAEQPSVDVIIVARSTGDTDIEIVSGATNIFTPQNWDRPLQITISAHSDADRENGTATIVCESDSLAPVSVAVTELDTTQSPPSVALTAPINNEVFSSTDVITFSAAASDDSLVVGVEFFANGNPIGSDATAPYTVTGTLPPGQYTITAKATDDAGLSTISTGSPITVAVPNQPPVITLSSPSDGAVFSGTAPITITASATDDASVSKVEFFANDSLIGASSAAPYAISTMLPAGTYSITARATDDTGLTSMSAAVQIEVEAPATPPEITAISVSSGVAIVNVTTSSGSVHVLEVTSDFQNWLPVATNAPSSGIVTFYCTTSGSNEVFRVVLKAP
jgi:hypothetical protein